MKFINPYDLLGLVETEPIAVKKAKRKKLLEFELSDDGMLDVEGSEVSKSDFLRVTDELDDQDKAEFYAFIKTRPSLNSFLKSGDSGFFSPFRHESIYADQGFISFISPYFAEQYSKLILSTFLSKDVVSLRRLIDNPILVTPSDLERAFKGLSDHLGGLEKELQSIRDEIDDEGGKYGEDNVSELEPRLRNKIDVESINLLPDYFQLSRNNLAQKIRNISVAVFNSINDAEASFRIISFAREIDSNNLLRENLRKDYEQIKEIYESRKESEKFSGELTQYASVLVQILQLIDEVKAGQVESSEVFLKVNTVLSIPRLNQLPNLFDEIREQIALSIRGLSITIWNERSDVNTAIDLVKLAQTIKLDPEVAEELFDAKKELYELRDRQADSILEILGGINKTIMQVNNSYGQTINTNKLSNALDDLFTSSLIQALRSLSVAKKEKIIAELKPILAVLPSSFVRRFVNKMTGIVGADEGLTPKLEALMGNTRTASTSSGSSSESGCLLALAIGAITIVIVGLISSSGGSSSSPAKYTPPRTYSSPSNNTPRAELLPPTAAKADPIVKKESRFRGNQLKNGASPFDGCFGKGKYRGSAWILFKNDNSSDAIVCLVNVNSSKTIRNEYIRAGANFKMTKVPKGTYYLKVFYGRDWNPNTTNACGTKGAFETNAHFSKSESPSDWIQVEDNDYSYTTAEITLYTVAGGNMSQSPTNAQDFFND